MNDVPPEVWITGHCIRSASSLTAAPVREVWTPCPTNRIGLAAARINFTASATSRSPAFWLTSRYRLGGSGSGTSSSSRMTCDGYSMYAGPGVPDMARRIASRMISSVWSAYSIELLYLTDGVKRPSCWTNWMRPRRTRRSVMRAR